MSNYRPVSMDNDSSNSDSRSINELDDESIPLLNEIPYEDLSRHARIRALLSHFPLKSAASMLAWKIVRLGIYCASNPAYHPYSDPLAPTPHFSSETSRETPTNLLTKSQFLDHSSKPADSYWNSKPGFAQILSGSPPFASSSFSLLSHAPLPPS